MFNKNLPRLVFIIFVLFTVFVFSCSKSGSNSSSNKEQTTVQSSQAVSGGNADYSVLDNPPTASVTPPAGWELYTGDSYTLVHYRETATQIPRFWIRKAVFFANIDEKIADYKSTEEKSGQAINWGETKNVTVNGYQAKNIPYTVATKAITLVYDMYFIYKDNWVFITICQNGYMDGSTSFDAALKTDYDAFLNSFKIE
jgi:hypothetical protein